MHSQLLLQLEQRGYQGRIVPIRHLSDLQEEMEAHCREGRIDKDVYQEYLAVFDFNLPGGLPEARSLIVVAVPQPQIRVTFTWKGQPVPLIVPPTYLYAQETDRRTADFLGEILEPRGYRVTQAVLPKKLLAVRSGLGAYGKNNICYVPGMGSFHRLTVFFSDLPCPEDPWQELRMMDSCQDCLACQHRCPVGAITAERFLLHAERCITFHNERSSDIPFPAWIAPSSHNCLVGCMHCQRVCPQDKEFLAWVEEGAAFSEEETALLVQGVPLDQLPATTAQKVEQGDLARLLDVIPRNLGVFLSR